MVEVPVAVQELGEDRRQIDMAVLLYCDPLLWLQQKPLFLFFIKLQLAHVVCATADKSESNGSMMILLQLASALAAASVS